CIWCDGVLGQPTRKRGWHPHGPRRHEAKRAAADAASGNAPGHFRRRARNGGRTERVRFHESASDLSWQCRRTLWRSLVRSIDVRGACTLAGGCRAAGLLHPCSSRNASRPTGGAAPRMRAEKGFSSASTPVRPGETRHGSNEYSCVEGSTAISLLRFVSTWKKRSRNSRACPGNKPLPT